MPQPVEMNLAHIVRSLTDANDLDATVHEIVEFARETIGADHAGLTLIKPRFSGFESIGFTDQVVQGADELQHRLMEGPCVDAAVASGVVRSRDLANDYRWPRWGRAVAKCGLRSILSIELHAGGRRIGALNLYRDSFSQFDDQDTATGHLFAYQAVSVLATARSHQDLRQALDTRALIGQAQGVLMQRFDIDASQAFNVLRRYSKDHDVTLVDSARAVVDERRLPSAPTVAER